MVMLKGVNVQDMLSRAWALSQEDDGVVDQEEWSKHLAVLVHDAEQADARAEYDRIMAEWKIDVEPAPVAFGNADRVRKAHSEKYAESKAKCDAKVAQFGRGLAYFEAAILTSAGVASGNPLLLAAALKPLAGQFFAAINDDAWEPPATPYRPDVVMPQVRAGGGAAVERVAGKATGINAAVDRGDLPLASGSSASAGETPTPPSGHHGSPHHGNPHHEPLKPGHKDTSGH